MLRRPLYNQKLTICIFQFTANDKMLKQRKRERENEREKHNGHEFVFFSVNILDFSLDFYHSLAK